MSPLRRLLVASECSSIIRSPCGWRGMRAGWNTFRTLTATRCGVTLIPPENLVCTMAKKWHFLKMADSFLVMSAFVKTVMFYRLPVAKWRLPLPVARHCVHPAVSTCREGHPQVQCSLICATALMSASVHGHPNNTILQHEVRQITLDVPVGNEPSCHGNNSIYNYFKARCCRVHGSQTATLATEDSGRFHVRFGWDKCTFIVHRRGDSDTMNWTVETLMRMLDELTTCPVRLPTAGKEQTGKCPGTWCQKWDTYTKTFAFAHCESIFCTTACHSKAK
ncbi:uncharacterized protein LOC129601416 [Paramacrobiotus metropolitanus]|uniref:uncharacterized protein LOC129601416 n=1 Tax=Paramacrobiotus metropolitanus TaxID=2943436 RepID=UPI00244567E5|nr:uncharacterized protein LOC129601416 [Paramacrobiotus metropolitanus]